MEVLQFCGSVIVFGLLCNEVCTRLPQKLLYGSDPLLLPLCSSKTFARYSSLFLLFPGADGPDQNTELLMEAIKTSDKLHRRNRISYCYDWQKWRGNIIRAAYDGKCVGNRLGKQVADIQIERYSKNMTLFEDLHVVGVSVGAFCADSFVTEYKKRLKDKQHEQQIGFTRLTLLDPFTSLGILGKGYGPKVFGKSADFCEQFLNSDDPVPFTNDPLPNAYVYDITTSRDRGRFQPLPGDNMHSWPVAFYGLNWKSRIDPRCRNNDFWPPNHSLKPRGIVKTIP